MNLKFLAFSCIWCNKFFSSYTCLRGRLWYLKACKISEFSFCSELGSQVLLCANKVSLFLTSLFFVVVFCFLWFFFLKRMGRGWGHGADHWNGVLHCRLQSTCCQTWVRFVILSSLPYAVQLGQCPMFDVDSASSISRSELIKFDKPNLGFSSKERRRE